MKIELDGVQYDYDPTKSLVSDAIFAQEKTGLRHRAFQDALAEEDALAWKTLLFLLKRRAGEHVEWDLLDFDLRAVGVISDKKPAAEPSPKEATGESQPTET